MLCLAVPAFMSLRSISTTVIRSLSFWLRWELSPSFLHRIGSVRWRTASQIPRARDLPSLRPPGAQECWMPSGLHVRKTGLGASLCLIRSRAAPCAHTMAEQISSFGTMIDAEEYDSAFAIGFPRRGSPDRLLISRSRGKPGRLTGSHLCRRNSRQLRLRPGRQPHQHDEWRLDHHLLLQRRIRTHVRRLHDLPIRPGRQPHRRRLDCFTIAAS